MRFVEDSDSGGEGEGEGEGEYTAPSVALDDQPTDAAVFTTYDADFGLVPEPRPAGELRPDWLDGSVSRGVRDALSMGWINRTPARIAIDTHEPECDCEDCRPGEWATDFDRKVVSTHSDEQMAGLTIPIRIIKFHCHWTGHLPEGYSALLTEPLGRPNPLFSPFSGCIDLDVFPTITHAPSMFEQRVHQNVPAGTPLLQIIPFKREEMLETAVVREATEEEAVELRLQRRAADWDTDYVRDRTDDGNEDDREAFETRVEVADSELE